VHPYHLELLKKLREEPLQANLVLSPGEMTNSAWQLAENPIFKKHVDQSTYHTLSSAYSMHDNLIEQSSQASRLMSEVNILGNFYLSPTLQMDLSEQDTKELSVQFKQGWIPIFESWTSSEEIYLERIDQALAMLEE
jgi:argininosuccinate synthase